MKTRISMLLVLSMVLMSALPAFATGMPQAHGVSGRDFGAAVSSLEPGSISDHVSGSNNGTPGKHGLSGRDFGEAVSSLEPGSISDQCK